MLKLELNLEPFKKLFNVVCEIVCKILAATSDKTFHRKQANHLTEKSFQ